MKIYFLIEKGERIGPFSFDEILEKNPPENALIWKKELGDWTPLKDLSEFSSSFPPPIPETEQVLVKDDYAGFWLRASAFLIDFIILFCSWSFIWLLLQLPVPTNAQVLFFGKFALFTNPFGLLTGWLYYSIFESSKFQATPGKAILGLQVTDYNYNRISFGRGVGRFFGKYLSVLILFVGYLMVAFTKNKQGLHDRVARTYVLNKQFVVVNRRSNSWGILILSTILFFISIAIHGSAELADPPDSFNSTELIMNIFAMLFVFMFVMAILGSFERQSPTLSEKKDKN
ncbi:MAG: RDD family protein [Cytophagia bacterium]|jgi:uncharacterized RDD family membrane protein YckC|nr:RDD family protein [Cytophagia bacterium]